MLYARLVDGVKVAVTAEYDNIPEIFALPLLTINVSVLIVEGSIGSLKDTVIGAEAPPRLVPLAGVVDTTVGGVVSGAVPVVKLHGAFAAKGLPAISFTPVVMVAV